MSTLAEKLAAARKLDADDGYVVLGRHEWMAPFASFRDALLDVAEAAESLREVWEVLPNEGLRLDEALDRLDTVLPEPVETAKENR